MPRGLPTGTQRIETPAYSLLTPQLLSATRTAYPLRLAPRAFINIFTLYFIFIYFILLLFSYFFFLLPFPLIE